MTRHRKSLYRICVACKSADHVIPVVYGPLTERISEDASVGNIHYGGAQMTMESPPWFCSVHGLLSGAGKPADAITAD